MKRLKAGIINETLKIFYKKKTMFFMIITVLIPIGTVVLEAILKGNTGISLFGSMGPVLFILGLFMNIFLPLFIAMICCDLFSGELGDKSIKIALLRPISRMKVFISKITATAIYIVASLVVVFVVSCLSLLIAGRFSAFSGLISWVLAYALSIVPMLVIIFALAFICQFFKSSSGAITVSILAFIALKAAAPFFFNISRVLFTFYTDWYLMWIGNSLLVGKIFNVFMLFLSYSIIFLSAGFYMFDRKEL